MAGNPGEEALPERGSVVLLVPLPRPWLLFGRLLPRSLLMMVMLDGLFDACCLSVLACLCIWLCCMGADTDAEQLASTEQLFDAALGELGVVSRGQPLLID